MKLINPGLVIQNVEGPNWLATFDHSFNDDEVIRFTVKISKSDKSLPAVQLEAFDRAIELMQLISGQVAEEE